MPTPKQKQRCTIFGALNLKTESFYWKSASKGNSDSFIEFLHQLRLNCKKKKLVLILDNVSYHKCRKLKRFLNKFKNIMMFFLPLYSPEYNPVEQVWQWTKENICFRKTPFDCIGSLKRQIKKLFYSRRYGKTGTDFNVGIGIWKQLFV